LTSTINFFTILLFDSKRPCIMLENNSSTMKATGMETTHVKPSEYVLANIHMCN